MGGRSCVPIIVNFWKVSGGFRGFGRVRHGPREAWTILGVFHALQFLMVDAQKCVRL